MIRSTHSPDVKNSCARGFRCVTAKQIIGDRNAVTEYRAVLNLLPRPRPFRQTADNGRQAIITFIAADTGPGRFYGEFLPRLPRLPGLVLPRGQAANSMRNSASIPGYSSASFRQESVSMARICLHRCLPNWRRF